MDNYMYFCKSANIKMKHRLSTCLFLLVIALTAQAATNINSSSDEKHWVGTWATAPMLSGDNNNPPQPGLAYNSLRQIVQVSIGGDVVRLKLSNHFGNSSVEIKGIELALAKTAGSSSEVDEGTTTPLYFDGKKQVTIPAGAMVVSDPVAFSITSRQNVAITIHYGQASSSSVCGHPGSRTTSYLASGNTSSFTSAAKTDHWYHILALEVEQTEEYGCVAVLGNSITDGRGSTTNQQNRWTDEMSRHLLDNEATAKIGVLNLGIGGNCVLGGGLGPSAVSRYQRDLFEQEGVKWIILFEGVNDLGGAADGSQTARRIIDTWRQIIRQAHAKGIRVFGATITPFKNNSYYSTNHEAGRKRINEWMRTTKMLDGVIDFAKAVCSPNDEEALDRKYLFENDWLHLNAEGYKVMGNAVDPALFTQTGPLADDDETDEEEVQGLWIEAESLQNGTYGQHFALHNDPMASGGQYLETVRNNTSFSNNDGDMMMADFALETAGTYYIYARVNCPSWDDDSYFVSMDNGSWDMVNGLFTGGAWDWKQIYKGSLKAGSHRLGIAGREDGALLDKLCITTSATPPITMGGAPTAIRTTENRYPAQPTAIYDISGRSVSANQAHHGLFIIHLGDGSTKKVMK